MATVLAGTLPAGAAVADGPAPSGAADAAATGAVVSAPTFASSSVSDERGDVVPIVIRLGEGSSAEVTVLGMSNDYKAKLSVSDDDRDGTVVVLFNTFRPDTDGAFRTESDGDTLEVTTRKGASGPLAVGTYRLLTDGGDERADLTIEPRETQSVDTLVAPVGASDRLATGDDVVRYRRAGNLTLRAPGGTAAVATRDTLVVRLKASGISGALAVQPGDTVTERFRALVEGGPLSLSVVQTNPDPDQEPARLALEGPGVHVVTRRDSNAYFLVVDTAAAEYTRGGETRTGLPVGARFRANVTVAASSGLAAAPQTVTDSFRVLERTASVRTHSEAGKLWVLPARDQRIVGNTTIAPGSSVTVTVRTPAGDFERTTTATVQPGDGRAFFETTTSFRPLSEGTTVEMTVRDATGVLTAAPTTATVRSPAAELDSSTLTAEGGTLQVTLTANLSRGGLVTVRADNASGRLIGAVPVGPGSERVSVPLSDLPPKNTPLVVRAVRDLDDDRSFTPGVDVPYEQANAPRPVALTIALYTTPPSPTPTPTATPTGDVATTGGTTPTGTGTATAGGTRTPTATDDGGLVSTVPGFGPAVALVALLVVLLRARRRG